MTSEELLLAIKAMLAEERTVNDAKFADMQKASDAKFTDMQKASDAKFTDMQKDSDAKFADMQKDNEAKFADMQKASDIKFADMQRTSDAKFAHMQKDNEAKLDAVHRDIRREIMESQAETLVAMKAYIENTSEKQIKALAEGYADVTEKLDLIVRKLAGQEELNSRVATLEHVVKKHSEQIRELRQA